MREGHTSTRRFTSVKESSSCVSRPRLVVLTEAVVRPGPTDAADRDIVEASDRHILRYAPSQLADADEHTECDIVTERDDRRGTGRQGCIGRGVPVGGAGPACQEVDPQPATCLPS